MSVHDEQFDDPQLKVALCRVLGAERATPALQARVLNALRAEFSTPRKSARSSSAHPVWMKYAVAALVLLGIIAGIEYYVLYEPTPKYDPGPLAYALPTHYRDEMVKAHGESLKSEFTDRNEAQTKLSARISHKVIVPDLPGWTFKGAQAITIAQQPGVRAVYQREGEIVSLFSIASGNYYGMPDGVTYDQTCGNLAIAGIVRNGMIYCVFTSPATPETIQEVNTLREVFSKGL